MNQPSDKVSVVFFSGGAASYLASKRTPGKRILLFTDTSTEDDTLYVFLKEAAELLGNTDVVWLKDGRDVWDVFDDVKYIGNTRVDPCSRILKREPAAKWIAENCDPSTHRLVFGMSWDEEHRMAAIRKNWHGWEVVAPMCDAPFLFKDEMLKELEADGLELPRLYKLGFPHNNCGGFCVKAGQAQFAHLLKVMPERYAYHERRMNEVMAKHPGTKPFLRKKVNGVTRYYTLTEWREYLEGGGEYDARDFGGCNCFFTDDDFGRRPPPT